MVELLTLQLMVLWLLPQCDVLINTPRMTKVRTYPSLVYFSHTHIVLYPSVSSFTFWFFLFVTACIVVSFSFNSFAWISNNIQTWSLPKFDITFMSCFILHLQRFSLIATYLFKFNTCPNYCDYHQSFLT